MSLMLTWLGGLAERASYTVIISLVKKASPLMLFPRHRYKRRLEKKLARMPFLFADMSLNVRDDYVALDVLAASPAKSLPSTSGARVFEGAMSKFGSYPRALIFGGGGYGKTTLFRNVALRCLDLWPWQRLFGLRGVLPLYVPLKVVKTSAEFPVLEAMLGSDPYFSGRRGVSRLVGLARRGRLVVLLDGYDEMAYTGGFQHVVRELEHIFDTRALFRIGGELRHKTVFEKSSYALAYEALRSTRVYLASRYEFFEYNPISVAGDVQRWVVKGLDDRRMELVEKIFSKYRRESEASTGLDLNSELFLQELTRIGDEDVVDLSKNPLFLTVMCYVYVHEGGGSSVFEASSADLARRCMRLLLEDLDRYKSMDATPTEQRAILGRRSDNVAEKYEFLSFFAVDLYEKERGFFDEAYMSEAAVRYFGEHCESDRADKIRRGLGSQDPTVNITKQIVLSGLLVLVDKRDGILYLDFPHRKFRETLAIDYFVNRRDGLLARISERQYSELVLAFVEQQGGTEDIIDRLNELVIVRATSHVGGLLVDVLRRVPIADAERAVVKLLHIASDRPGTPLPAGMLEFIKPNDENWALARLGLGSALKLGNETDVERWSHVAAKVNLAGSRSIVNGFGSGTGYRCLRAIMHSPLLNLDQREMIVNYVRVATSESHLNEALADLVRLLFVGGSRAEKSDFRGLLRTLLNELEVAPAAAIAKLISTDEDDYPLDDVMKLRSIFVSSFS